MLCLLVEIAHWSRAVCWESRGRGVDWALKVLLLFFVGGAASCEKLLRCQKVDAGDEPLNEHSFRVALPHLRCKDQDMESAWALYVGYGSAFAYGIMIPSFLVYLIAKQNLELAINRRCVCWWTKANQGKQVIAQAKLIEPLEDDAETAEDKPEVAQQDDGPGDGDNPDAAPFPYSWQQDSSTAAELQAKHQDPVEAARQKSEPVDGGNPDEEIVSANLLAAAIAYAAVFFRGEVTIERKPDSMTLEQKDGDENDKFTEIDATSIFSTMFSSIASKEHKTDIDIRRCQSITRMLAEHEVIEKKAEDDRILAGAKTIFFKYAACDDVWVEASLKVVAVALVTTVSVNSALLTLFITVGMAILLGAQKPYKQRQVNDLQSGCFICLSMAALGFWLETPEIPGRLLARLALVLPFLAAGVQMLRPDGPEALALRLHQEAKAKLKESKSVELSVKKVKFI
ncbi:unnamed protein product [Symbiodinium natans]|uniref:Uncharacterized protein n=1 Tax=Symbiodinium natans TaxID=878477 RepID=A0A812P8U1_9DINO|nr:unnamed protein product [Symbiodinium natans]